MKKSLIALAALAVVSAASAQSTVTISGNMAAGQSTIAGVRTISGLDATNSNLLNFAAVEDLGGGLKATANIGIRFDVNQAATNTTGFGKPTGDQFIDVTSAKMGGVRVGTFTSYTPAPYSAFATWDVARTDAAITTSLTATVPSVNSVAYTTPDISGFKAKLTRFTPVKDAVAATLTVLATAAANADVTKDSGTQVLLSYANGPLLVAYGTTDLQSANGVKAANQTTLDGTYDFGMAKLFVQTWENQTASTGATNNKGYGISVNVPYQAFNFKVGMRKFNKDSTTSTTKTLDRTSFGVTYSLSKRTTAVALLAKDKTITSAGTKTTNSYLGLTHSF